MEFIIGKRPGSAMCLFEPFEKVLFGSLEWPLLVKAADQLDLLIAALGNETTLESDMLVYSRFILRGFTQVYSTQLR